MNVTFSRILSTTFGMLAANLASIVGAAILWFLTILVPYINVGTTIAMLYGLPLELSRGGVFNPLNIFDSKYRKHMGEVFLCAAFMVNGIYAALLFLIIPGIVVAIAWTFSVLLVIDKHLNPAEAILKSNYYTYGHKWTMFLSSLVIYLLLVVVFGLLIWSFFGNIEAFITLSIIAMLCLVSIGVCIKGTFYKLIVLEREDSWYVE